MSERTLVDYVLRGMKGKWVHPVKHADAFTPGIADLSAWIAPAGNVFLELKALPRWPARANTKVDFGLEKEQELFLCQRRGWLFVRVKRDYLLFDSRALKHLCAAPANHVTAAAAATAQWNSVVNWSQFALCLSRRFQ